MVALALGSFGIYQIRPPQALMRWAGGSASGAAGALFMGLTMGVVAAPCVGPVLVGLLVFVGSRQDPHLGFLLFFVLALGMGAPYVGLALAAGSLKSLPRSGALLEWIERVFGCVLLALAAYFVGPLLPAPVDRYLLPAVLVGAGAYLGLLARVAGSSASFAWVRRAAGIAFVLAALWVARPGGPDGSIAWERLAGLADNGHPPAGSPLLIDFVADWCIPCVEMERTTYVDADVIREAERFRMVKADVTREDAATTETVERYQVRGVPTVILYGSDGRERQRLVGYVGPVEMLAAMRQVD
jgi:thiol:disulfide interchange protein DsbD